MKDFINHTKEELNDESLFHFEKIYAQLAIEEKDWINSQLRTKKQGAERTKKNGTTKEAITIEPVKQMWAKYVTWLFGIHYLYFNKFGIWLIYCAFPIVELFGLVGNSTPQLITGGALFTFWIGWVIVDLFRIPSLTDRANKEIAIKKAKHKVCV